MAARVAGEVTGDGSYRAVRTMKLLHGRANTGCWLHDLYNDDGVELRLVEKRSTSRRERMFSRMAFDRPWRGPIYPRVHWLDEDRDDVTIVMEFLGPTLAASGPAAICEAGLMHSLSRISDMPCPDEDALAPTVLTPRRFHDFCTAVWRQPGIDRAARAFLEASARFLPVLNAWLSRNVPMVATHGDIYFPNMAPPDRDGGHYRFLDWGAFGLNYAGAELHHFMRAALYPVPSDPAAIDMDSCIARYSAHLATCGIEAGAEELEIGALYFALSRSIDRVLYRDLWTSVGETMCLLTALRGKSPFAFRFAAN